MNGFHRLGGRAGKSGLWFQHEFGIWPDRTHFITTLRNLKIPKVVTFHTIHFQSNETHYGLRRDQYDFLASLLPVVDAITVFSGGAYQAVTSAFTKYRDKVHVVKHGVHLYPQISRLSRREAKEKFFDYLLHKSNLDKDTKHILYNQRLFLDKDIVLIGQTGFLSPNKGTELLYEVRETLQKMLPDIRIVAVRVGGAINKSQELYADILQNRRNGHPDFLFKIRLPEGMLPLAQRAFDINFYWPSECTQSGVLSHALGAGAIIAGRDLEGVGETLKDAGELCDTDMNHLILKMKDLILQPALVEKIEDSVLTYAQRFCWEKQIKRHFDVAACILAPEPVLSYSSAALQVGYQGLPFPNHVRTEYAGSGAR